MQAIDYSKYENMSQAALKEQIKEAKLKLKQMQKELNLQSKLVEFLTQKLGLNKAIDIKESHPNFEEFKKAIKFEEE